MIRPLHANRRRLLQAGLGVSVLALSRNALAAETAPPRKLIVVILRGGLDGLSLAPPYGDPAYAALRKSIAIGAPGSDGGALDLDGYFGLHPALPQIWALARRDQARIVPAAVIPVRQRSHFEAQDILETGSSGLYGQSAGWVNRLLALGERKGLGVGASAPLVIRGPAKFSSWAPGPAKDPSVRLVNALMDLYASDPRLGPALSDALQTEAMAEKATSDLKLKPNDGHYIGEAVARVMAAQGGPDIAALSVDGFDTHAGQGAAKGQLANRLAVLDDLVGALQTGLGSHWNHTVLVAATEFGRTARINGTGGTDHGTGSCALLAGGALRPGGIVGDWPTLAEAKLFENRDLAPSVDIRSVYKGLLRDHLGVDNRDLETQVFPDSAVAKPITTLV